MVQPTTEPRRVSDTRTNTRRSGKNKIRAVARLFGAWVREKIFLFYFEKDHASVRRVEICRHSGIARLIRRECERAILDPVYRLTRFANVLGKGTIGDYGDELLRIRVFPKSEGGLVPLVGIRTTELQVCAGDDEQRTFHVGSSLNSFFLTLPCSLEGGRV